MKRLRLSLRLLRPLALLAAVVAGKTPSHANVIPNAEFETIGPLGASVTNTVSNTSGPSAAATWTQYLLTGTYLVTRLDPSADTLSGACGNMLTIRCNSPGTGSGGSTVSVNLPAALPPGSRGQLNVRVLNGSARIGFLVNTPTATVFDGGGVQVSTPTNVWHQITFTNGALPAAAVAIQVYAPTGQEAVIQVDHAAAMAAFAPQAARYDYAGYFGPLTSWVTNAVLTNQVPVVGDFNGDGLDDIATFLRDAYPGQNGNVRVALNSGGQLASTALWQGYFGLGAEIPMAGDFDGDGRDDILVFVPGTGKVWVALSTGTSFCSSREWWNTATSGPFFYSGEIPLVGDVNGDGRTDIITFSRTLKSVYVGLSTGTNFTNAGLWQSDFCPGNGQPRVGDVNGDGKADIVCFVRDSRAAPEAGRVEVALSTGTSFQYGPLRYWHQNFAPSTDYEPLLADLNGDGSKDIVAVYKDGRVLAAVKTAVNSFASGDGTQTGDPLWQWHPGVRRTDELVLAGRFNPDLNADLAVFSRGSRPGAEAGSVFVSLCGGHAQPEPESRLADFGYGTMGVAEGLQPPLASRPAFVSRPLLVILAECAGNPLSRTVPEYEQGFFGPAHPNIASWYLEMSDGQFTFSKAAVAKVGPYACPLPDATSVRTQLEDAANADGLAGFEFKNYDTDGNGIVEDQELALCVVSTFGNAGERAWGQTWPIDVVVFPGTARQMRVRLKWAGAGDRSALSNFAHELCHATCGMVDLYGSNCRGMGLTLASCTAGESAATQFVHLDPWHRIRLGWVKPLIYDLKNFPAGAAIKPPQASGERPVILFDSSRGTNEFFVLEHRNGHRTNGITTWTAAGGTWRAPTRVTYPAAGYDIDAQDTAGNRQGFLTWAVKTDASNNVLDIRQGILAGPNGVLNSTRLGDDVSLASPPQIHAGPDGILQSVAAGDDTYWQDALALPTSEPANITARISSSLNPSGEAATTLRFYDSADTGVRVRGDAINGNTWQFLEWGRAFRPFVETLASPAAAKPGDGIIVLGSLGRYARFQPRLISPNNDVIPVEFSTWTGSGGTFKIPTGPTPGTVAGPRSGRYRFLIFDSAANQAASNVFPLDILNASEDWRMANFNAAELLDPAISGDGGDPDKDGQPNLMEYLLGTNPRTANPSPLNGLLTGGQLGFTFAVQADRGPVRVTLQFSVDLIGWWDVTHTDFPGTGTPGTTVSGYLFGPTLDRPKLFARLSFSRI